MERVNGTLQDRLVKELALAGITSIAAANGFLDAHYLQAFNDKFAIPPVRGINAHRTVPAGMLLEDVLCLQESRTVGEDWCIRLANRILQIDKKHAAWSLAGRKIQVLVRADGTLKLTHQEKTLHWKEVARRPVKRPEALLGRWHRELPGSLRPIIPRREPIISPATRRDRSEVNARCAPVGLASLALLPLPQA